MSKTRTQNWTQNPEGVKADILRVAVAEFAAHGLAGARVDEITAQTKTSKRMIYYYFGDKKGLYRAALEHVYAEMRASEAALELDGLAPEAAIAALVRFTFDHHRAKPDFIRMVMNENMLGAEFMRQSERVAPQNQSAITRLEEILGRGRAEGVFRDDIDPVALHWKISALATFNMSNRATFSTLFGDALFGEAGQEALREDAVRMILADLRG